MSLSLAIVGVGHFAQNFIPLFKAHPQVKRLVLCDLDAAKRKTNAETHGISETSGSLEAVCESDVDAVAIFSQHWLHGPQAAQALRAGKHVYSAVPPGLTVDEITTLADAAAETQRVYMLGETSYYYPEAIYCRQRYARGDFGHVVYAEAEYLHDWDHGLYDVARWRGGDRWLETAGSPPLHYPTHSTSMVVSVTGARMTHVSCHGFVDRADDGIYQAEANWWGNVFSNETALFRMSDGSSSRINEFRRVGHPGEVRMRIWGTEASFESNVSGARWVTKDSKETEALDELLACKGVTVAGRRFEGVSAVHPVERLPDAFQGLPNGHQGSHQFLVDDFVRACLDGRQPPNHVWAAARYMLPGILAHESALRRGELLEVPDLGDPPE